MTLLDGFKGPGLDTSQQIGSYLEGGSEDGAGAGWRIEMLFELLLSLCEDIMKCELRGVNEMAESCNLTHTCKSLHAIDLLAISHYKVRLLSLELFMLTSTP